MKVEKKENGQVDLSADLWVKQRVEYLVSIMADY
jgi:hypothetical protein